MNETDNNGGRGELAGFNKRYLKNESKRKCRANSRTNGGVFEYTQAYRIIVIVEADNATDGFTTPL